MHFDERLQQPATPDPRMLLEHDTNAFLNAFVLLPASLQICRSPICTRTEPVGNECECIRILTRADADYLRVSSE